MADGWQILQLPSQGSVSNQKALVPCTVNLVHSTNTEVYFQTYSAQTLNTMQQDRFTQGEDLALNLERTLKVEHTGAGSVFSSGGTCERDQRRTGR
ncbi:hypothetical protein UY3_10649 [Chelonia mydas]|uniref:Uncharacterized protein n=1 Tax=Chelonia mydas TaxID=8469 RepID=M7B523_CHEMY|nr:hypothetical protein UY3_10649 [Chelonia mydas]